MKLDYKITDDSGFIGIVNPDVYNTFVDEDWQFEQLIERFTQEMNNETLVLWNTGFENTMRIIINDIPKYNSYFREFSHPIKVTNGRLCLVSYDDLSYCAQFNDEKLPSSENDDLIIELENGHYFVSIRQLKDPENFDWESNDIDFEIVIIKQANDFAKTSIDKIPWFNI